MAGPNDMASWMQSLMQQGGGQPGLGPSILAWLQSIMQNPGASQPYGPGTPTGGAGPQSLMPGGGVMGHGAATPGGPSMGYPAMGGLGAQPSPQPTVPWRVPPANEGPRRLAPAPPIPDQFQTGGPEWAASFYPGPPPPKRPFNWLTSTGAGMSTPPGSPSAAPVAYGGPTAAADAAHAPKGPLASPDAAAPPMKRKAGAPNLGYYVPTTGNARAATLIGPDDPRYFRG